MEPDSLERWEPYWPLMKVSLGIGVIAIPIGLVITFIYAFSGMCPDSDTSCSPQGDSLSSYVLAMAVLSGVWLVFAAIVLVRRHDPIPVWAVLLGLIATGGVFHGLLWAGFALTEPWWKYPLALMLAAPFVSALFGAVVSGLAAGLVAPPPPDD